MKFDVVVVGGGLAGASLAVALRGSGLRIGLVEHAPPAACKENGFDQRIYAISPASRRFLDEIGIWPLMNHGRIQPVHEMDIYGDGSGRLRFDAYASGLEALAWIVESSAMRRELWETLKRQHNVELIVPAQGSALEVTDDEVSLTLDNERVVRASLVVGADGGRSWVRTQCGMSATSRSYDERGVVANFACEQDHHGVAFQWFRDEAVLAWLPLPGRRISMVWSAPEALAAEMMALNEAELAQRVARAGAHRLGELVLESEPAAFPLRFMHVPECVGSRVALIGDAARAIHPLSGHGINLGFQDAAALARILKALPSWRDPGELTLLRRYARATAEESLVLQHSTDMLNRLFKSPNPLVRALRNQGMNLTDRMPVVRDALVRYATQGSL